MVLDRSKKPEAVSEDLWSLLQNKRAEKIQKEIEVSAPLSSC